MAVVLDRDINRRFERWLESGAQRALLVTGARQIGKTYSIRRFLGKKAESSAEINFLLNRDAATIFTEASNAEEILFRLSTIAGTRLIPGKTIIFLDEIQESPEALTMIKALVDEGSYRYILSGSLLGVTLKMVRSNPVGYVDLVHMYPLSFFEFCQANNLGSDILDHLRTRLAEETNVDTYIHARLMELYHTYLVVGGMPQAVASYVEDNNLAYVRDAQAAVIQWYRADIAKYLDDAEALKALDAFNLIPSELSNPNKRFVLKNLNEKARLRSFEDALLWLNASHVALAVYNVDAPTRPLMAAKKRTLFKLFYCDVGLLTSQYGTAVASELLTKSQTTDTNFGAVYENAVAQELYARGFTPYYYNSKKRGEIDFVVETKRGTVLPIEVKSGKNYKRHRALDNILTVPEFHLEQAIVLGETNVERVGTVLNLPVYMAGLIDPEA